MGHARFDAMTAVAGGAGVPVQRVDCTLSTDSPAPAVAAWRDPDRRPEAVYAYNDEFALVLIQALRDAGLDVPRDIAVAGSDNLPLGAALRPQLTTTYLDLPAAAAVARTMERLLQGEDLDPGPAAVARSRLVIRESARRTHRRAPHGEGQAIPPTGPPAHRDGPR
ncbi:substrate-binding domain-containing protein [Streptomyces sp. NPDC006510]|uniref:substrate-binding domain-containing protein n=1 Tax=Streptomyces sp. NPDC006510 TaxID=3155600 RepID=UPI0033A1379E